MDISNPLFATVVLLSAGVIGLAVARFAHTSPIVGFFMLGALIGPQMLGLIDNHSSTIHFLGELGVSFLLFDIGLHLSLKELGSNWKGFFFSGTLQFLIATTFLTCIAKWLGLSWESATVIGAILSLSSTALVLKILSDEDEDSSPVGKRATEVLVFQDIIAILLVVLLSGDLSHGISLTAFITPLFKMILAAMCVVYIGRLVLRPLFRLLIALKSDEVITAFALLLVFLSSWATQSVGLSLALGAFLGGLALSESSYSHLVRAEISPFRSLLLSLFFLSVGINLDLATMLSNAWILVELLLLFISVKIVAHILAFRISRMEGGVATLLSFLLAQGSEFAFVLLGLALSAGLINTEVFNLSVCLVGISLAATPLVASIGCLSSRSVCRVHKEEEALEDDSREVIIVRIDEYGRRLANLLDSERIPYRAHDFDLERLAYAKSRGFNVYYSDINRPRTLGRVSMGKALAVVSLLEDDQPLIPLIEGLKKIDASVPVLAATDSPGRMELLSGYGIEQVFIKNENSIIALFEALIRALGYEQERIEEAISRALQLLEPEGLFPSIGSVAAPEPQPLAA